MGIRSLPGILLLASIVGACAMVDPVDTRYDTISRSLAQARNEAIFLNLVRASHDYPLSFTVISQVTPSMTNTSSLGLPSFLLGPGAAVRTTASASASTVVSTFPSSSPFRDIIFGNTTASDSTAVSSNFNVATQETSAFYEGFLRPIDLQVLDYFIRQGYSRELLYWLFADTVELKIDGHTIGMRYDPPRDYGCDRSDPRHLCFPDFIRIATAAGLTVEDQTLETAGGGSKGGGSSGGNSKGATTIFSRFCFDPVLARRSQNEMGDKWLQLKKAFDVSLANPKCGSHWDPVQDAKKPQPDTLNFSVGPYQFRVTPRSAFGVFEFLGALMKMQREQLEQSPTAFVPPSRLDVLQPPLLTTAEEDPNVITVAVSGTPQCFVHTWFYDGDYCVPENATTTKRIFSLLAQLIAIQTEAADLSITPIVRIIQ